MKASDARALVAIIKDAEEIIRLDQGLPTQIYDVSAVLQNTDELKRLAQSVLEDPVANPAIIDTEWKALPEPKPAQEPEPKNEGGDDDLF